MPVDRPYSTSARHPYIPEWDDHKRDYDAGMKAQWPLLSRQQRRRHYGPVGASPDTDQAAAAQGLKDSQVKTETPGPWTTVLVVLGLLWLTGGRRRRR